MAAPEELQVFLERHRTDVEEGIAQENSLQCGLGPLSPQR